MAAKKDPLLKVDVAARRGIVEDADVDSWDAVLIRGEMDEIGDRLVKSGLCGVVRRDVTAEALKGTLKEPGGEWVLLVKIRGQEWVVVAGDTYGDYDFPEELAKGTKLGVMRLGYQDTAGATYFTYYEKGKAAVDFESCGMGDDEEDDEFGGTRFKSDRHKKGWIKGFESEEEVRGRLVEEFGAYVPMIFAGGEKGKIGMFAWHEDVLKGAGNVERVDLAVFGPAEALKESPAGTALKEAIKTGDAAGVRQAIRDRADLRFLPEGGGVPLDYAVGHLGWGEKRAKGIEVVEALLEGGADAKGAKGENPPVFACVEKLGANAAGDALKVVDLLVGHGAEVNAPAVKGLYKGQTALHHAAIIGKLALVKGLVARGADVKKKDGEGRTPRKAAEQIVERMEEYEMEDGSESGEVVAFLKKAEKGEVEVGDVGDLLEADRRKEERRQRKAKVAFSELGEMFKALGKVMEGGEGQEEAAARIATLGQPDEIHVRRDDGAEWKSVRKRDQLAKELEREGYERFGVFVVDEMPAVRMLAMLNREENVYGVVGEMGGARWVDLVRYHADGTAVTVTNAPTHPAAEVDPKGKRKVRMPGEPAAALVAAMRKERAPKGGVQAVTAEEFAGRFERYYAEEMRERKRGGRKVRS